MLRFFCQIENKITIVTRDNFLTGFIKKKIAAQITEKKGFYT